MLSLLTAIGVVLFVPYGGLNYELAWLYLLLFFICVNTTKSWKYVSPEIYFAWGAGGNYIVADNEHDLVIVVRWMDDSKMSDFMNLAEQSVSNKFSLHQ